MKILIFEEVRTCSTKKLWDGSRVQGKDQEEEGLERWMHEWDRNWKTKSATQHPRLDTCWGPSPCLVPLDITLGSHELGSWPNSEAENGNDLVSWMEVIWSVSLMTRTSMEPLKFSKGKSRNNQKTGGRKAKDWRAYRTNKLPNGGSIFAVWKFTAWKWDSAGEASNYIKNMSCNFGDNDLSRKYTTWK